MNSNAQSIAVDGGKGPEPADDATPGSAAAALPRGPSQGALALRDIVGGARASHLWGMLAWQDIRRRYRRSVLGPIWLTISMGVLVARC